MFDSIIFIQKFIFCDFIITYLCDFISSCQNKRYSLKCIHSLSDLFSLYIPSKKNSEKSYLNKEADDFNETILLKGCFYFY